MGASTLTPRADSTSAAPDLDAGALLPCLATGWPVAATTMAAAVAAGADGVFLEFHPEPDKALCDGPSCLPLDAAAGLLKQLKALHEATRAA